MVATAPDLITIECSHCGTKYRLKAGRLKAKKKFKCAKCNNLFKVTIKADLVEEPKKELDKDQWYVIDAATKKTQPIPSLDGLQRWIIEGKIGPDDVLTKGSRPGKKMGQIEKFAAFFRVQERSGAFPVAPDVGDKPLDLKTNEPSAETPAATVEDQPEASPAVVLPKVPSSPVSVPAPKSTAAKPTPAAQAPSAGALDAKVVHKTDDGFDVSQLEAELGVDDEDDGVDVLAATDYASAVMVEEEVDLESFIEKRPKQTASVALLIGIVVALIGVGLALVYLIDPETFYNLFPFFGG